MCSPQSAVRRLMFSIGSIPKLRKHWLIFASITILFVADVLEAFRTWRRSSYSGHFLPGQKEVGSHFPFGNSRSALDQEYCASFIAASLPCFLCLRQTKNPSSILSSKGPFERPAVLEPSIGSWALGFIFSLPTAHKKSPSVSGDNREASERGGRRNELRRHHPGRYVGRVYTNIDRECQSPNSSGATRLLTSVGVWVHVLVAPPSSLRDAVDAAR